MLLGSVGRGSPAGRIGLIDFEPGDHGLHALGLGGQLLAGGSSYGQGDRTASRSPMRIVLILAPGISYAIWDRLPSATCWGAFSGFPSSESENRG